MERTERLVSRRPLSSWILASGLKLQALLLVIILIMVVVGVLPLELQKRIVNEAIRDRTMRLLFLYCGLYLAAVLIASGLRYVVNVLQNAIGERALAQMRKELFHFILTLPLGYFRRTQPGMVVQALVTELAAAGDFVGMAVAVPVTSVLTLLAFAGYLVWLNPLLAVISLGVYPLVLVVLPRLQNRVNVANQRRVDITRTLSSRIGEAITGIHEIQGNGSFGLENRRFDDLVDGLFKIRVTWSLYRFAVKVCNTLFNNLSPLLVFIVGGYLAIKGRLDLGALVAFLSAQEKLYEPWRDLVEFYQTYQDAKVRYRRTMEYFDAVPDHDLEPEKRKPHDLEGSVEVKDLSFVAEGGVQLLDRINLSLTPGEHLALVGFSGSGKSTLAQCIGQLYKYKSGHILFGGREVAELSKRDMICNMGFVSQRPFTFDGSIRENLLYACASRVEGNGCGASEALPSVDDMIEVLQQTGIFVDVLRFGLNTILAHDEHAELASRIIRVREQFRRDYGIELRGFVEFFDPSRYLHYAPIAANLTFGSPNRPSLAVENLATNDYFLDFLKEIDLTVPLLHLGAEICTQTVEILGSLPPEPIFFERSPIAPQELDGYGQLAERLRKVGIAALAPEDQQRILELALRFTSGRHKMVALPEALEERLLQGRIRFREKIAKDDPGAFSFYEPSEYIYSQSILDNILFGKAKTVNPSVEEKINRSIIQVLIQEDLLETIVEIGMEFQVGTMGDKLSGGQRQKLAIARVLLKGPRLLILDEATSALDNRSQARIQGLVDTKLKGTTTLIAVVHRLDIIRSYDKIAVMRAGRIGEMGTYEELIARKGILYELVYGKGAGSEGFGVSSRPGDPA
jgi:ABC-type multidrug transport system fused ATPase/permease subunit